MARKGPADSLCSVLGSSVGRRPTEISGEEEAELTRPLLLKKQKKKPSIYH